MSTFDTFRRKASHVAGNVVDKGSEILASGKVKLSIAKEKHAVEELYYKIGSETYRHYKDTDEIPAFLVALFDEVEMRLNRMEELKNKDVQNNKEEVPFAHYESLFRDLDPEAAAARCGVPYENGMFTVTLLGETYQIAWPEYAITAENPKAFALKNIPTQTFLLRYLLEGKKAGPWMSFKTFREMPWGELYISPYTGRVLTRAAFTFGTRVGKFAEACEKMGGARVEHGDAGYEFDFLGGYRMQIMVYAGDDEFPPSSQVLYSDNFETGFSAEDRVVAGDILISSIKNNF